MKIPKRNENIVAIPKPSSLTTQEAFDRMFARYKEALKELSLK